MSKSKFRPNRIGLRASNADKALTIKEQKHLGLTKSQLYHYLINNVPETEIKDAISRENAVKTDKAGRLYDVSSNVITAINRGNGLLRRWGININQIAKAENQHAQLPSESSAIIHQAVPYVPRAVKEYGRVADKFSNAINNILEKSD